MDQAVHARNDLSERAERHELEDLDLSGIAHAVLGLEDIPRIVLLALVAEGDLLVLLIQTDDEHLDLVADIDDLGRVLDAAPGQLGDVDHAVHAADVNKRAVGGQGLDRALVLVADLDGAPDLLRSSLAGLLQDLADRADHALALAVDLGDIERLSGLYQLAHGLILGYAGLAGRDKHAHAVSGRNNAAAVLLDDRALDHSMLLISLLDGLPALELVNALLGQRDRTFTIVYTNDNCLDLIARMDVGCYIVVRVVRQLIKRDIRSVLHAKVDLYIGRGHCDNGTGDFFSCI